MALQNEQQISRKSRVILFYKTAFRTAISLPETFHDSVSLY